jgi:hypothetical protein
VAIPVGVKGANPAFEISGAISGDGSTVNIQSLAIGLQ